MLYQQTFHGLPLLAQDYRDTKRFEAPDRLQQLCVHDRAILQQQLQQFDQADRVKSAGETPPSAHWVVPACGEQPAVDLFVYRPTSLPESALAPVLYFMHSGGYLLGHATDYSDHLWALAQAHQAVLVSVEYRTAAYAPFPADIDDAYHGLRYLYKHASDLGLDRQRMVLFGESAGGGLAARLALRVRDVGTINLAGQVLIYPMLDARTGTPQQPAAPYTGEFYWNGVLNQVGWELLRAGQTLERAQLPYYSASLAHDLSALPRTFILCGALDLFAQESLVYAQRLHAAGVVCDVLLLSGVYHAFEYVAPQSPQSALYEQARLLAVAQMFSFAQAV